MGQVKGISRLRAWRTERGLTLREVADLTGLSEAMVSRAERAERRFNPMTKVLIARRLGVEVSDIFEVEEIAEQEAVDATR